MSEDNWMLTSFLIKIIYSCYYLMSREDVKVDKWFCLHNKLRDDIKEPDRVYHIKNIPANMLIAIYLK